MRTLTLFIFLLLVSICGSSQVSEDAYSVVTPVKMNVIYIGLANPVDILAPGLSDNKTMVSVTGGNISKTEIPHRYNITANKSGRLRLKVFTIVKGDTVSYGEREFRVKRLPDPVAKVAGKNKGNIKKELLLAQTGIKTELLNCDFDIDFRVVGYTVSTMNGEYIKETEVSGAVFTKEVYQIISSCKPGQKIYFENVKVLPPDGCVRNIGSFYIRIE